ncbi:hypothetical protein [Kingella sp. (in: b-proteobacteria)]|uniref:hypothetical protein n=1 Tax=Kingella sp. (in: b-proteobacteria) TaxID=2020713 RepID=UPI0026DD0FE6|nr:hypothetical protein [Kingella sp. (in: b-proteobacteria)]MDO4657959.1 hypothetical protein [Kingella sp. (in: b-proteobacteria)]
MTDLPKCRRAADAPLVTVFAKVSIWQQAIATPFWVSGCLIFNRQPEIAFSGCLGALFKLPIYFQRNIARFA